MEPFGAVPVDEIDSIKEATDFKQWTPEMLARYLLQHVFGPTDPDPNNLSPLVITHFQKANLGGLALSKITMDDWKKFLNEIYQILDPFFQARAKSVISRFDPLYMTLQDIHTKLHDCTSGLIWFKSFTNAFKRDQKYDLVYGNESWCLQRGGRPYVNPCGYRRYGFYPRLPNESPEDVEKIMNEWHVAYHGTSRLNIDSIVQNGLVPPGAVLADGKKVEGMHGTAGAPQKGAIYVSPSIEYSSHWVYTNPQKGKGSDGNDAWVYYILQVRVKPGSFKVQGNTLWDEGWGDKKVPYDLKFGPDELEWVIPWNKTDCLRVTGLMVQKRSIEPKEDIKIRFAKNKALLSTPRGKGKGKWSWNSAKTGGSTLATTGPWKEYDQASNDLIEKAYLLWLDIAFLGDVSTASQTLYNYYVDFKVMEQRRTDDNNLRRLVKREVLPEK